MFLVLRNVLIYLLHMVDELCQYPPVTKNMLLILNINTPKSFCLAAVKVNFCHV